MGGLRFELGRGVEGLDRLESDWRRLTATLADPTYVQHWEWHRSLAETLLPDLGYAAWYEGPDPLVILPFRRNTIRVGGVPITALGLPTHDHMQHSDLVVRQNAIDRIDLRRLLADLAEREGGFDVLLLGPVLADSTAGSVLAAQSGLAALTEPLDRSDSLPVMPFEKLVERVSRTFRSNLRRARKRLEQMEGVRLVTSTHPDELVGALERFYEIEASGWKGANGTASAISMHTDLRAFYSQLVTRLGRIGGCAIHTLMCGDTAIAAQIGILNGQRVYLVKIAYDEAYAHLAPGNMLLVHIIHHYEGHPTIRYTDLVSSAAWHDSWHPDSRAVINHFVFRPSARGMLARTALQGKQALRPVHRRVAAYLNTLVG
jgi:CelD/BcsL family acetyltransferase involved in cellulose biosynthesis